MPNEKAILTISTSGEISMEIVDDKEDFLRVMQRVVGGYVQTVPDIDGRLNRLLGVGNAVMICNEEGYLQDLPRNPLAQVVSGSAPICGPVAIVQVIRTSDGEQDLAAWPLPEMSRLYRRMSYMMEVPGA